MKSSSMDNFFSNFITFLAPNFNLPSSSILYLLFMLLNSFKNSSWCSSFSSYLALLLMSILAHSQTLKWSNQTNISSMLSYFFSLVDWTTAAFATLKGSFYSCVVIMVASPSFYTTTMEILYAHVDHIYGISHCTDS